LFISQGGTHASLHPWWHTRIALLTSFWRRLEHNLKMQLSFLDRLAKEGGLVEAQPKGAAALADAQQLKKGGKKGKSNRQQIKHQLKQEQQQEQKQLMKTFDALEQTLDARQAKREAWNERAADPIFRR
jgi:hypothetical protein